MKNKNLIILLTLCSLCLVTLCGCSSDKEDLTTEVAEMQYDKTCIQNIQDGIDKLKTLDSSYIISTQLDEPKSTSEFLTVVDGNVNYTEYSVDENGEYGTISYGSSESITYTLSDYVSEDGVYALITGDDEENPYYTISDDYSNLVTHRSTMWVDYMLDKFTECYEYSNTTITLIDEDVDLTLYQCKLPSEYVQTILGVGSVGIYKDIVNNTENDNIRNLFQYYLDNSEYTLACSDANVLVGIDKDGLLRYMGLEVGGLGTNLYFTSVVVDTKNTEVRQSVDISNAKPFETLYTDLADYCAKYDTVEDALETISYNSQNVDTNTLEDLQNDLENVGKSENSTQTE